MFIERYEDRASLLHALDPRVKLITTLVLIVGIVLTPETAWPAYPLLWALVSSMAALAGIRVLRLARLGGVALPFALAAITLTITTPGDPLFSVLGQTVTAAGIGRFVAVLLKSWLSVQVALLLAITTPFTDLLWALTSLRVPAALVAIIGFMYRYLETLRDESERLMRARTSRSATVHHHRSGGTLGWRARTAGYMVGSLFLRGYERSERVYAAMLARGYRGQLRRLDPPPLTWRAVWLGALPVLALAGIETLAVLWWQ